MTQKQLIELIQQHHPDAGETEIRLALNRAKDDFCAKTEIITSNWTQTSVAGQRYYSIDDMILRIKDVQVNDVSIPRLIGKPVIDDDEFDGATGLIAPTSTSDERYWYVDGQRLGLVEKTNTTITREGKETNYQSIAVAKEIRITAISKDVDFTGDLTETGNIPSQFREALAHKVISEFMLRQGSTSFSPELSEIFSAKYTVTVKDAKSYARDGKINSGSAIIVPTDF
jgi:hypothetical protein